MSIPEYRTNRTLVALPQPLRAHDPSIRGLCRTIVWEFRFALGHVCNPASTSSTLLGSSGLSLLESQAKVNSFVTRAAAHRRSFSFYSRTIQPQLSRQEHYQHSACIALWRRVHLPALADSVRLQLTNGCHGTHSSLQLNASVRQETMQLGPQLRQRHHIVQR